MKKFNTDLNQINDWISLKECQNEFDAFTRLKASQADQTILLAETERTFETNKIENNTSKETESGVSSDEAILQLIESYKSDLASLESDWLADQSTTTISTDDDVVHRQHRTVISDRHTRLLISPYVRHKCAYVRRRLERLESGHKLKLESNLVEVRHGFARTVADIMRKLSDELSYVKCGKSLSSQAELDSSARCMKRLLAQLDRTRDEMRDVLDKYETQLRQLTNSDAGAGVLRLDELDPLDPKRAHVIMTTGGVLFGNRELEAACRCLLGKLDESSELATVWTRYESLHGELSARLEHTSSGIQRDLAQVDRLVVGVVNLVEFHEPNGANYTSGLYEPVVTDMIENRRVFDEFDRLSTRLGHLLEQIINNNNNTSNKSE